MPLTGQVPKRQTPTAAARLPEARIVATNVSGTMLKGSGHWLMEEATEQAVPAIVAFLQ